MSHQLAAMWFYWKTGDAWKRKAEERAFKWIGRIERRECQTRKLRGLKLSEATGREEWLAYSGDGSAYSALALYQALSLCMACGILAPDQGLNLHPLQWKCRVLTTGPRGKIPAGIILMLNSLQVLKYFILIRTFRISHCCYYHLTNVATRKYIVLGNCLKS